MRRAVRGRRRGPYAVPIALALASAIGLVVGLAGDIALRPLAWAGVGAPLLAAALCLRRRPRARRDAVRRADPPAPPQSGWSA